MLSCRQRIIRRQTCTHLLGPEAPKVGSGLKKRNANSDSNGDGGGGGGKEGTNKGGGGGGGGEGAQRGKNGTCSKSGFCAFVSEFSGSM